VEGKGSPSFGVLQRHSNAENETDHEQLLPSYTKIFSSRRRYLPEKILLNSVAARASRRIRGVTGK